MVRWKGHIWGYSSAVSSGDEISASATYGSLFQTDLDLWERFLTIRQPCKSDDDAFENPTIMRSKRVRSKVSNAPSTISIPHPQASESAFKHTPHSQKTRFLLFFENSKNYSKTTVCWKCLGFLSNIATPVRPTELRKNFHRLTHIFSIRSQ